jgi:hypothetical protein
MATLSKGKTFTNGELVTPATLHSLVDSGTVTNIVNADISNTAAIADSKLAQISTAGKVLAAAVQGTLANARTTATSANTANAIVARDASGDFSAGKINGVTVGMGGGSVNTNTAVGLQGLNANTSGNSNTAVGWSSLQSNTTGQQNTAAGTGALLFNTTGSKNTAFGANTFSANTTGYENTAIGANALFLNTTGYGNIALGYQALLNNTTGRGNTACGFAALLQNTGNDNTAVGGNALFGNTTGTLNTAIGLLALQSGNYSQSSGVGYNAQVTGSNQVQLGNSTATTYAYGAVQDRSDVRDKADIRDTTLGLDFVNALRPVDFRWDYREDYRPFAPTLPAQDASAEEKAAYKAALNKWQEDVKLANITHDGSKKRNRYHHGLIAQEVKAVLDAQGLDFGGYQDHSIKGGDDVLSLGYEELIAPLIKAVQELAARVAALEAR